MEKANADEVAMVKAVTEATGMPTETAERAIVLAHWQRGRGFTTTNDRAEIRRLEARLQSLEAMRAKGDTSRQGAWQRHLNQSGRWAAKAVAEKIEGGGQ
ncbi:hypothetical protein AJ87_07530 [Rhizobium yanglingense]|nr:hypothetical protein AJ87_07530 [Rhizobium yanglingense]